MEAASSGAAKPAQRVDLFCGDYNNKQKAEGEAKWEPLPRRVANDGKAYTYKEFFLFYKNDAPRRWRLAGQWKEYVKQQPEYDTQLQELQKQSWRSSGERRAPGGQKRREPGDDGRMCPMHRLAGQEAGPHPSQTVMVCGCCAGTCELCDPELDPYN